MKRVFVIHGWKSSPESAWKPWLKTRLEKKGLKVVAPQMPDPASPQCSEWIEKINEVVKQPTSDSYFVGHSLGATSILRYLETIDRQVGGAVLVAGPSSLQKRSQFIKSFFAKEFNWKKIRKNCKKFIVIHSDNDTAVPIENAYVFRDNLNADLIIEHQGHFTESEGIVELPAVLECVLKITG